MNIRKMLMDLLEEGPMTRDQLCEAFGFEKCRVHYNQVYFRGETLVRFHRNYEQFRSRTTLYDNLEILRRNGKVEKFSKNNGRKGRPLVFWRLLES